MSSGAVLQQGLGRKVVSHTIVQERDMNFGEFINKGWNDHATDARPQSTPLSRPEAPASAASNDTGAPGSRHSRGIVPERVAGEA